MELKTRKEIIKKIGRDYQKASKKEKGGILDNLIRLTGYERSYARFVLRNPPPKFGKVKRNKPSKYEPILEHLKKIWAVANFACGKILTCAIPTLVSSLKEFKEIKLTKEAEKLLLSISAATCDRLLKPERKGMTLKGRSGTKLGTLLKSQIPVRIFTPWNEEHPGFLEIDLVAHCGDSLRDTYLNSFDGVDPATCWTEKQAFRGRGELLTLEAFEILEERFPFRILGIDSDNDSLFINGHFLRLTKRKKITFTRSRPYRRNDQAHIEQKNYSTVRKIVGYKRLETEEELKTLNEIYLLLSDYLNFFIPTQKLVRKGHVGARVKRIYGRPQTPYQRVLSHPDINGKIKVGLKKRFKTLNPAHLIREINRKVRKLTFK